MKSRIVFFLITFVLLFGQAFSQNLDVASSNKGYQFGIAVKLSAELSNNRYPTIRLGLSGGLAGFPVGGVVYPSLHAEMMFYNHGFGSPKPKAKKPEIVSDFLIAGTITAGGSNRMKNASSKRPGMRNYPLYYFANFTRQPLQNPFNYSGSLGSIFVFTPSHEHPFQQIGFLNVHVAQFQACYYNDGTPFQLAKLGDYRDRYYTGGGLLSFTLPASNDIDILELGFNKYSGFVPNAFEIANDLDLAFLNYSDSTQNYFNKSNWSLSAISSNQHYALSVDWFNKTKLDVQHIIHRKIYNAYHRVLSEPYITPRFTGLYSTTKIGLK